MSYILSALKKAERDRHLGEVPDLSTADMVDDEAPRAKTSLGVKLAVGVVLLAAVNGAFYFGRDLSVGGEPAELVENSAPAAEASEASRAPEVVEAPEAAEAAKAVETSEPAGEEPSAPPGAPLERDARALAGVVVNYDELPESVRDRLPALDISGHVFVPTRPHSSRVIINGRLLRVGQAIEGVRVIEISPGEAVFESNEGRFRMRLDSF